MVMSDFVGDKVREAIKDQGSLTAEALELASTDHAVDPLPTYYVMYVTRQKNIAYVPFEHDQKGARLLFQTLQGGSVQCMLIEREHNASFDRMLDANYG